MTRALVLVVVCACGPGPADNLAARGIAVHHKPGANGHAVAPAGTIAIQPQRPHDHLVRALAISPDGAYAATGGDDDTVALWDLHGLRLVRTVPADGTTWALAFAPDGNGLVVGGQDAITRWSLDGGDAVWSVRARTGSEYHVDKLDVSAEGKRVVHGIAGATDPGMAVVVDADADRHVKLEHHPASITAVAISADGKLAVTGTEHGHVLLWDAGTGASLGELAVDSPMPPDAAVQALGVVDGDVYAVYADGAIAAWNATTHAPLAAGGSLDGFERETAAVLDPDAHELRVASLARIFTIPVGFAIGGRPDDRPFRKRVDVTLDVPDADHRDGHARAVAARAPRALLLDAGTIRIVDTDTGAVIDRLVVARPYRREIRAVALAAGGASAWIGHGSALERLDLATMETRVVATVPYGITGLAACGDRLVARSIDGLHAIEGGKPRLVRGPTDAVAWSPGCDALAAADHARVVMLAPAGGAERAHVDLAPYAFAIPNTRVRIHRLGDGWQVELVTGVVKLAGEPGDPTGARSADGAWTVTAGAGGTLDVATPGHRGRAEPADPATAIALAADGTLYAWLQSGWLETFDPARHLVARYAGEPGLAIDPASGRGVGLLYREQALVALATPAQAIATWRGDVAPIVAASLAGGRALSAANDGTLRLWDVASGDWLAMVLADDGEWARYAADGLFDASLHGDRLVGATDGRRTLSLDQVAAQYDRPDLLLARFGLATEPIRAALEARVASRQAKLGAAAALPVGAPELPRVQIARVRRDHDDVELDLELAAAKQLAGYRVDVNGVPAAAGEVSGTAATARVRVALSPGDNRVEVSAIDRRGLESYRATTRAHRDGTPERDLYFVGFGVSAYQRDELRLGFAAKDANDLAAQLLAMRGHGYRDVIVTTFEDDEVDDPRDRERAPAAVARPPRRRCDRARRRPRRARRRHRRLLLLAVRRRSRSPRAHRDLVRRARGPRDRDRGAAQARAHRHLRLRRARARGARERRRREPVDRAPDHRRPGGAAAGRVPPHASVPRRVPALGRDRAVVVARRRDVVRGRAPAQRVVHARAARRADHAGRRHRPRRARVGRRARGVRRDRRRAALGGSPAPDRGSRQPPARARAADRRARRRRAASASRPARRARLQLRGRRGRSGCARDRACRAPRQAAARDGVPFVNFVGLK